MLTKVLLDFRKNTSGQEPEVPGEGMHSSYSVINFKKFREVQSSHS